MSIATLGPEILFLQGKHWTSISSPAPPNPRSINTKHSQLKVQNTHGNVKWITDNSLYITKHQRQQTLLLKSLTSLIKTFRKVFCSQYYHGQVGLILYSSSLLTSLAPHVNLPSLIVTRQRQIIMFSRMGILNQRLEIGHLKSAWCYFLFISQWVVSGDLVKYP